MSWAHRALSGADPMSDTRERREQPWLARSIIAVLIAILGLWLLGFGAWLAALGGSLYYVLAGVALLTTAVLLFRRQAAALVAYAALLTITIIWAVTEVGLDFWQLAPRGDLLVPI